MGGAFCFRWVVRDRDEIGCRMDTMYSTLDGMQMGKMVNVKRKGKGRGCFSQCSHHNVVYFERGLISLDNSSDTLALHALIRLLGWTIS